MRIDKRLIVLAVVIVTLLCLPLVDAEQAENVEETHGGRALLQASSSVTTTTQVSWGQQLKDSIQGVLIGLALFLLSFPVLVWNECKAAAIYRILTAARNAVKRNVPSARIDRALEGKLVHMVGQIETEERLRDEALGLEFPGCVKYRRGCEMFQWVETRHTKEEDKLGGGKEVTTTYTYSQQWSTTPHRSSTFHLQYGHENPSEWPLRHAQGQVTMCGFGNNKPLPFLLSTTMVNQMDWFQHRSITDLEWHNMSEMWRHRLSLRPGGNLYLSAAAPREGHSSDFSAPQIGDMRITYEEIRFGTISLMAKQTGASFVPWTPPSLCAICGCAGRAAVDEEAPLMPMEGDAEFQPTLGCCNQLRGREDVIYCDQGEQSAPAMLSRRAEENAICTWIFRIVGFAMMWIGLDMILNPFVVFVKVWPFLSQLLGAGIGLATGVTSIVLTLLTASVSWIAARPLLVLLLVAIASSIVALVMHF